MKALIVVDIQNDFLPGGALAVPSGDEVVSVTNELMPKFDLVVATQDWHPANHGSFAENHTDRQAGDVIELNGLQQILWPTHCVQHTSGASFASGLNVAEFDAIFQKGTDPQLDSYSGFFDNDHRASTGLDKYLREKGIEEVSVVGLATDYCVKFTALDAVDCGFKTTLIVDACRGVNLNPDDCETALAELSQAGIVCLESTERSVG